MFNNKALRTLNLGALSLESVDSPLFRQASFQLLSNSGPTGTLILPAKKYVKISRQSSESLELSHITEHGSAQDKCRTCWWRRNNENHPNEIWVDDGGMAKSTNNETMHWSWSNHPTVVNAFIDRKGVNLMIAPVLVDCGEENIFNCISICQKRKWLVEDLLSENLLLIIYLLPWSLLPNLLHFLFLRITHLFKNIFVNSLVSFESEVGSFLHEEHRSALWLYINISSLGLLERYVELIISS